MQQNHRTVTFNHCSLKHYSFLFLTGWTFLFFALQDIAANALSTFQATQISPQETLRNLGDKGLSVECFETYIPSLGTLALEAVVTSPSPWEVQISPLRPAFQELKNQQPRTLRAFSSSRLLEIRAPGSYRFCVATQDPRKLLGSYSLRSVFVDQLSTRSENPDEEEPNPEPATSGPLARDENPEEEEPNPEPLAAPSALCAAALEDDHSDLFICATELRPGQLVQGELASPWGDDRDVLTFTVDRWTTLEIFSLGTTDTFGTLYDHGGLRLAWDGDSADGSNFRIAKTLMPGRYFLRVEGQGSARGQYRLTVRAWDWP